VRRNGPGPARLYRLFRGARHLRGVLPRLVGRHDHRGRLPASYTPGQDYLVSVVHRGGSAISNFNASVRIGSGVQTAGTISAGYRTETYSTGEEPNGVHQSSYDQDSCTFAWAAPDPAVGVVRLYLAGLRRARSPLPGATLPGLVASFAGIGLQVGFVAARALGTGFLPFASRFESMALFALSVQVAGLGVYLVTRQNSVKAVTDGASVIMLLGALVPVGFRPGGNLNPILNSRWFAFHILVAFAGYGCFTAGLA